MATFTNLAKSISSFANQAKANLLDSFLLKEDSFFLLLETGDKIVLSYGIDWNNQTKN